MQHHREPAARRRSATSAESDALFLADFGPRWPRLPWSGQSEAEAFVGAAERARLRAAREELRRSWLADPAASAVRALGSIARGTAVIHGGARRRLACWVLHDAGGRFSRDPAALVGAGDMGKARLYALDGADRFAERPVNISTLIERPKDALPLFQLLAHRGLHHQLRAVSYDEESRLLAYFGLYLPAAEPAFTLAEHALLHALLPDLRRWVRTARAIGLQPLNATGLTAALEANPQPCYLLRGDGVIVLANAAARRLPLSALTQPGDRSMRHSTPLQIQSEQFELLRVQDAGAQLGCDLSRCLPPALRRVAAELTAGRSDKEIASQLDMRLATVRTYVSRIYAATGVASRRELMRRAGEQQRSRA